MQLSHRPYPSVYKSKSQLRTSTGSPGIARTLFQPPVVAHRRRDSRNTTNYRPLLTTLAQSQRTPARSTGHGSPRARASCPTPGTGRTTSLLKRPAAAPPSATGGARQKAATIPGVEIKFRAPHAIDANLTHWLIPHGTKPPSRRRPVHRAARAPSTKSRGTAPPPTTCVQRHHRADVP